MYTQTEALRAFLRGVEGYLRDPENERRYQQWLEERGGAPSAANAVRAPLPTVGGTCAQS